MHWPGSLLSHSLARYSDRQGGRKLIQFCLSFGILACLVFALSRNYWVLVSLGTLLSIGGHRIAAIICTGS